MAEEKSPGPERLSAGKKDLLILYDKQDSEPWAQCIRSEFTDREPVFETVDIVDLRSSVQTVVAQCSQYLVVAMVVSPEMISLLEVHSDQLASCLSACHRLACIRLYLEDSHPALDAVLSGYPGSRSWQRHDVGTVDTEESLRKAVGGIRDSIETARRQLKPPSMKKPAIASVCPDNIRQGGERVMVALSSQVASLQGKTVQVSIADSDAQKIDTKIINHSCFTFTAPSHKPGAAYLYIFIDGKKVAKTLVHYSPMRLFAYTMPEFLCQLLGYDTTDKDRLDHYLAGVFESSSPQDHSLAAMLTPKNIMSEAGVRSSEDELPTLLHFACKYGLSCLASSILEAPFSSEALSIVNKDNMNPLDIAQQHEHEEIVKYIEVLMEMQDYMTEVEDIYEKMAQGSLHEAYINKTAQGYMQMGTRPTVEDYDNYERGSGYVDGKVPAEEDYEVTDRTMAAALKVTEVEVDDDIIDLPIAPPPPDQAPPVPSKKPLPSASPRSKSPHVSGTSKHGMSRPLPPEPDDSPHWLHQPSIRRDDAMPPDDIMAGKDPVSQEAMGSNSLDQLSQIISGLKSGEFSKTDCEFLYNAWIQRNKSLQSNSIRERKVHLEKMKVMFDKANTEKKPGLWARLTSKKPQARPLEIQHHVQPNSYESWQCMEGAARPRNPNRDSIVSNASTNSSSSSSSRDSMQPIDEVDVEQEEVKVRRRDYDHREHQSRRSSGAEYMQQNKKISRLPRPPPKTRTTFDLVHSQRQSSMTAQHPLPAVDVPHDSPPPVVPRPTGTLTQYLRPPPAPADMPPKLGPKPGGR